jgi:hypothetical protein
MIWLGEIVAGETVPVRAQFHNDTGAAADPTDPFARMETGSGTFADLSTPTKRDSKTGYFGVDISTTGFAAGIRTVRIGGTVATNKAVAAVYGFRVVAHRAESAAKPSDLPSVATLESRLTAARAGYLDKLNVSGTLAHSDAAATYKADVSGLPTLTAQQVWEYVTRELTASAGGATAQEVWEYATRALTDKNGFSLTADYDHAKDDVLTPLAVVDGKVDALKDFDPATQTVNVGAVGGTEVTGPDDLKADVSGVLEAIDAIDFPPPDDGVAITQATLGTDGDPLGRVMPYGRITAYLGTVPHYQFDADADGDYAYTLPAGSAWTLVARRAGYRTMTTEVTT